MAVEALYFDGETARDNKVTASLAAQSLTFSGEDVAVKSWNLADLASIEAPHSGHPLRLSSKSQPGARLSIRDDEFIRQLLAIAPHLKGGFNSQRALRVSLWIGGCLAVLAGLLYLILNYAPQRVAVLLPDAWSERVGRQMEASLVENAKVCSTPAGDAALRVMLGNLAEGNPDMPPLQVRVYDIAIMNAFTLPGGHIVITRGLLAGAAAPDEVAGVLAHEIGHAAHHHPEAQLVRVAGLQILLSAATGNSGGNSISSVAGLAAILRSSRDAESEADAYAVAMLSGAHIDPMGLKHFFEKILAQEGKSTGGALSRLGSIFSTHPGTEERIEHIKPLPSDVPLRPSITDAQWNDLKKICG